jgi:hypothetical protein
MNFCFWPVNNFEYAQFATHIQQVVKKGITLSDLAFITENGVVDKIFHGFGIPSADERARILREMSSVVLNQFNGSFAEIIKSAGKSAVKLLNIFTQYFPNFQDHSIY